MQKKSHGNEVLLGVNVDHVATLRQARGTRYPEPLQAALEAEHAGADSITMHLREDRRHIQDRDVLLARDMVQTKLNLEMAMTEEMVNLAERLRPRDCCLVPERREELTTEGGLDVSGQLDRTRDVCARLADAGVRVSLFIDPELSQLEAAVKAGAPTVEIHTGHYADAVSEREQEEQLGRVRNAVRFALDAGLQVNAGHGLHYHNVMPIAAIPGVTELNIGHSIVARALFSGFPAAVREMKVLLREARRG
ncbi:MAG: pyridoxine 5'-phosphate synthase [Ectothiorhodospiraceae bacterium]|jgi:pyridoxine 5-phosphate synthase